MIAPTATAIAAKRPSSTARGVPAEEEGEGFLGFSGGTSCGELSVGGTGCGELSVGGVGCGELSVGGVGCGELSVGGVGCGELS
ncbi:hypothetical protein QP974_11110, partial [Corynebacterium striatum]|nr:hypothetical protein [Corynebacterium striatum]